MSTTEELLQGAAKDGSLVLSEWPRVLPFILERLETNVYKLFPIPKQPQSLVRIGSGDQTITLPTLPSQPIPTSSRDTTLPSSPPAANKTVSGSPEKPAANSSANPNPDTTSALAPSRQPENVEAQSGQRAELPKQVLDSYNYVRSTLCKSFANNPPHTIQRLAELILFPRQHYRFLSRYLNALDRTVSVSSGPAIFPTIPPNSNGLTNGVNVTSSSLSHHHMDDTEALGGALLTPIPWLRNRSEASPTAADRSSTSPRSPGSPTSTGAVTQGELLRQEQKASGPPAPVASLPSRILALNRANEANAQASAEENAVTGVSPRQIPVGDAGIALEDDPNEEPHALGPEAITPEDMGPQPQDPEKMKGHMLDLEAAVGRPGEGRGPSTSPEVKAAGEEGAAEKEKEKKQEKKEADGEEKDGEGDVEEMEVDSSAAPAASKASNAEPASAVEKDAEE